MLQKRDNSPNIRFPGSWTLFGGVVEKEESPDQAIYRELQEETGIKFTNLIKRATITWEHFEIVVFEGKNPQRIGYLSWRR